MASSITVLREALGFSFNEVALKAGWSPNRQQQIEASDDILADEADVLSALLGVDVDALLAGEVSPKQRPLGALLKGQAGEFPAEARFILAHATTIAREIQELRGLLGLSTGLGSITCFQNDGDYSHPRDGVSASLAAKVRTALDLQGPIRSVTREILEPLGVILLWAPLPREVDALAFATEETGAVVVVNVQGQHTTTVPGLRVALAHEICHLAFDRHEMIHFVRFCHIEGGLKGSHRQKFDQIERRARAFAPYLLAPPRAVKDVWCNTTGDDRARVRAVMDTFGLGYRATRAHLDNVKCLALNVPVRWVATEPAKQWVGNAEMPPPVANPLRTGELARLARKASSQGLISERRVVEIIRGPLAGPDSWQSDLQSEYWTTSMARSFNS